MLKRQHDFGNFHRDVILVLDDCHCLAVGAKPRYRTGQLGERQAASQAMGQHHRQRQHFGRLIGGVAHHHALVACPDGVGIGFGVQRVIDGTWKNDQRGSSAISYWWGMTQGVISVLCSRRLPTGTRRLAGVLRDALRDDRLDPFYGTLVDQKGRVVYGDEVPISATQILSMNWLSSFVEGRIPAFEELSPTAQELVRLQGVERQGEK